MIPWIDVQREQLKASLRIIRGKRHLRVTQPFFRVDHPIADVDVFFANDTSYRADDSFSADIFFCQGYSPDLPRLRYLRRTQRAHVLATWFWDNHHLFADTMHAAIMSDVYFYAHGFCSAYVHNEFSLDGGFVPLCPVFWSMAEVESAATQALLAPRSNELYGGYNSYAEFPERDVLIEAIKARLPNNRLFITPHGTSAENHPFYGMSAVDRLLEWMHYKSSLCLSFGGNTAIRIFDMLLGGGIPLIVGRPHDLDNVFPKHVQDELPIIVVDSDSPEAIAAAHQICLDRFDAGGVEGIMRRHMYMRGTHMPHHRLEQMISAIRVLAERCDDLPDYE